MDAVLTNPIVFPPDPARRFSERWGGHMMAFAFSVSCGFMLFFAEIPPPSSVPPREEVIRVALQPEPTPLLPENLEIVEAILTPEPQTQLQPEAAAATTTKEAAEDESTVESEVETSTSPEAAEPGNPVEAPPVGATQAVDSSEAESLMASAVQNDLTPPTSAENYAISRDTSLVIEGPQPELPLIEPPSPPETTKPDSANPSAPEPSPADTTEKEREFLKEIEERKVAIRQYNQEIASKGSDEIADRLQAAALAQKGKKWLTTTEGVKEGIIRSLDTSDVTPAVAEEVLDRYGIKVFMKMLDGQQTGYNFLNQARTRGGTYYNRVGKGMYQVFSFGQPAVARMMQLELDELRRRGYDPAKARVTEVEFGIIPSGRGFDLGIKKLEVLPVEVSAPETARP